ncbi:TetR/AcrR family transcriptional regulator [Trujillonella endophytica]|uniref:Transcriptional regulator, TetR family n=1 Tax=Trujillonella endophytica TaxID=673521 RepID=A0A1H8R021_9ACTN|nr:TetR/AcrR family transcriptional regulator [Trujillella endophytica]SEO59468.1 transcriptional regulator, TetR family [Trujillella endophytica]
MTADAAEGAPAASPREERRQQRVDLFRSQVLDAAEEMFAELGYHGTNLKAIAARCEVSVGSLYSVFDGKDALFAAVLARSGEGLTPRMTELARDDAPADVRLLRLAELQVRWFREHPNWARITTAFVSPGARADLPGGEIARNYEGGYRWAMELQAGVIAAGQRDGLLRTGDPGALARMFSAMVSAHHVIDEQAGAALTLEEFLDLLRATFVVRPA